MLASQAFLVASFGLDASVWARTGSGDGPPLPFRRMQGKLEAVFPPAPQPPSPPGPPSLLSSPRGFEVNDLLGFTFPASIRLYDPGRPGGPPPAAEAAAPLPRHRALRVSAVPPQQWGAAARAAASGLAFHAPVLAQEPAAAAAAAASSAPASAMHSFTLPSGQCGSVLTRWHRVADAERVGLMRLQLAVAAMQRSEGSAGGGSAEGSEEQQQ